MAPIVRGLLSDLGRSSLGGRVYGFYLRGVGNFTTGGRFGRSLTYRVEQIIGRHANYRNRIRRCGDPGRRNRMAPVHVISLVDNLS